MGTRCLAFIGEMSLKSEKKLDQWLKWLEETRPEHEIDFGLDRIRLVGEKLNLLKPAPFVIMVGGTNGKGSTLAVLESILLAAGYKVGLFTSPHLLKFNERIRINGQQVSDEWLCDAFEKLNEGRQTTWLTYFEFATLAAVDCFQRAEVDFALMEVGMGGRLDATNVVDPDISIITTVGLDHQEYLGFSIEAIAKEKAGIMRSGKPVIFGSDPVPDSVVEAASRLESQLYRRSVDFDLNNSDKSWSWSGLTRAGEALNADDLPLPDVVIDNAATALQALQFVPEVISIEAIRKGLSGAAVKGRFQRVTMKNDAGNDIELILDVAHNPQAAEKLSQRLQENPVTGVTRAVIAMCKDKDYMTVADCLSAHIDDWRVSEFVSPRTLNTAEFAEKLKARDFAVFEFSSIPEALNDALNHSKPGDRILVTGSFMTVSAVLALVA